MPLKEYLCISYFDNIIGPNTFFCNEELSSDPERPNLGRILEFAEDETTFILAFTNFQTVNHIFLNNNPQTRGGEDLLMVSYLIRGDSIKDDISDIFNHLNSKKPILKDFAEKLTQLEELPEIIVKNKQKNLTKGLDRLGSRGFQEKFHHLVNETMQDLKTKKNSEQDDSLETIKKLFILGAYKAGKKTFLDQVKAIQSKLYDSADLSTKIFDVVLENVEVLKEKCYDDLLQCKQCEVNNRCITQAQGFVIIFDNSRKGSTKKVKDQYRKIAKEICKLNPQKGIPVLLIANKFDKNNGLTLTTLSNEWKEKQGKECNIVTKHIELDLKNDSNTLQRSFQWLIKQMI